MIRSLFAPCLESGTDALTRGNGPYNLYAFVVPIRCQITTSVMVGLVLVMGQELLQGVIADDLQAPF